MRGTVNLHLTGTVEDIFGADQVSVFELWSLVETILLLCQKFNFDPVITYIGDLPHIEVFIVGHCYPLAHCQLFSIVGLQNKETSERF